MKKLSQKQIDQLERQGCISASWDRVSIDASCDLSRIRNVEFGGTVTVGPNDGEIIVEGMAQRCGIYNTVLVDTSVGRNVRIANIGSAISRYEIGDESVIEDVGSLVADEGTTFGSGTEVEVVNEAGGRHVVLFPMMSAQTSFLQAFRLHDRDLQSALDRIVRQEVAEGKPSRGVIGRGVHILHCGMLRNLVVGEYAVIDGAAHIEDATIMSCSEHPTYIGSSVQARHTIVAEGARVDSGAMLEKVYVGQASKLGKLFSAENCLFFANCEGYHGEAVAIFAGPYTVTHHKSTLLIAAQLSFYNAGSGTNQSNHMYKLGPVHQGIFERGCKTGSFSYVLHETHVGAFSVIIGKHYVNIDTGDLPFSNIHEADGQSRIVPGLNLFTVGTVRDGEKWPARDGRKAPDRRDCITFDVFSPYTIEKMRRGRDLIRSLQETTPKDQSTVKVGGLSMKRLFLRKSAKFYQQAIIRYVYGKVLSRLRAALQNEATWTEALKSLEVAGRYSDPGIWVDVAGLLIPRERLVSIEKSIVDGSIATVAQLNESFRSAAGEFEHAEWEYVAKVFETELGYAAHAMTIEQAHDLLEEYEDTANAMQNMILDDSRKEFDTNARIGYGIGMDPDEIVRDFEAVRGTVEKNSVVSKLAKEKEEIGAWVEDMKKAIEKA